MGEVPWQLTARMAAVLASLQAVESVASRLCEAGRRMLDADGAALTVMTSEQSVLVVAATNELSTQLEDLQEVVGEGPSRDAYRENAVQVADFAQHGNGRWSLMHEHGRRLGFEGGIIAVPLRPGEDVIGTLTAHRASRQFEVDPATAEFLGVAIGLALVQDPQLGIGDDFLAEGWPMKAKIHQATGMVISQVGVRPEDALALLRGQAFANNTTLGDIAQQIIDRHINFEHFMIEGD
ncbi:MAG: GAF and ANTAR domain-containing protein [Aeromicrobium sp.]